MKPNLIWLAASAIGIAAATPLPRQNAEATRFFTLQDPLFLFKMPQYDTNTITAETPTQTPPSLQTTPPHPPPTPWETHP